MFITAYELENDLRRQLASMDAESVLENREAVTARLRAMGMYDLARDFASAPIRADEADNALSRLYAVFGVELLGGIVIEDLTPELIEFECLYGLTDPVTNEPGREVSFTVKDLYGRFPINLSPENIAVYFSVTAQESDISYRVKSCVQNPGYMSTRVVLDVRISDGAFHSEGTFIMRVEISLGKAVAASRSVRFNVKNTFPDFFRDDFTGKASPAKPLPPRPLPRSKNTKTFGKEVFISKGIIQTRQKNTRINFDKQRGHGVPLVLCGSGAFKAGIPSRTSVNISFRLTAYKALERRLMSSGITMRLPPETSVWVEWDEFVVIYNLQYKGFLID
ncbi:MAG: hypothetical protein FWE91_13120 [Defluviitaleaceae bacterium]|nr:hypothetical protein [Defluviitaleaceae bacterium]MCL2837214.1 hypothetical protein [Defluviitaleaceae bacterium]